MQIKKGVRPYLEGEHFVSSLDVEGGFAISFALSVHLLLLDLQKASILPRQSVLINYGMINKNNATVSARVLDSSNQSNVKLKRNNDYTKYTPLAPIWVT